MDDLREKRNVGNAQRKSRIKFGSASAPLAILITYAITDLWGKQMSQEVVIALSTLIGSGVSVVTICFWDLRGIVLNRVRRRRRADKWK